MGTSHAIKFGPVELATDPLVALVQKRPINVIHQYTNDAKTIANVILIKYDVSKDHWRIQDNNFCLLVESELERC